jgi:hypothetical protein
MPDARAPGVNPLSEDDLVRIDNALHQLDEADAHIVLAEQAGFDVAREKAVAQEQRAKLRRIRQAYFPGR